ncbi:CopG family transcriptional regulator [uncultured Enterococcus sp.]|uniref:CopG family transcriptional regulator n=1 Tax=uncultured Enterococcus sp. TaxID=167972 RepID=UPI0022D9B143|nr:CopG family transcriptional regulator [uncultured Enterococcus sp.]CAI3401858.1 ribbon-helix-helix protein, CopG family [Enterococcus cecorum]
MATIKVKGIDEIALKNFDKFCKKQGKSRAEMIRQYIHQTYQSYESFELEIRMKSLIYDILKHLDLNTQALMMLSKSTYFLEREMKNEDTFEHSTE